MNDDDLFQAGLAVHELRQLKVRGDGAAARAGLARMIDEHASPGLDLKLADMLLFSAFFLADFGALERVVPFIGENLAEVRARSGATPPVPQLFHWEHRPGLDLFEFSPDLFELTQDVIYAVYTRWVAWLRMVAAFRELGGRPGSGLVDVGDWSYGVGMRFCDNRPGSYLVPDSSFLSSFGYRDTLAAFERDPQPWAGRAPAALWRGSSTGMSGNGLAELPRMQLCRLAATAGDGLIDAGITSAVQLTEADTAELAASGLMRPAVPVEQFNRFKYQIDIDGNTNSWPGLFQKLLTGSPVLKVASPHNFSQWYYPRLIPWYNFVPVRSDMADLEDAIRFLRAHDDVACRIGQAGLDLARTMDVPGEARLCLPVIEAAFQHHEVDLRRPGATRPEPQADPAVATDATDVATPAIG